MRTLPFLTKCFLNHYFEHKKLLHRTKKLFLQHPFIGFGFKNGSPISAKSLTIYDLQCRAIPPNTVNATASFFMSLWLDGTVCFDKLLTLINYAAFLNSIFHTIFTQPSFNLYSTQKCKVNANRSTINKSNNALLIFLWPPAQHATVPTERHSGLSKQKLIMQPRSSELDRLPAHGPFKISGPTNAGFVCQACQVIAIQCFPAKSLSAQHFLLVFPSIRYVHFICCLKFDRKFFDQCLIQHFSEQISCQTLLETRLSRMHVLHDTWFYCASFRLRHI